MRIDGVTYLGMLLAFIYSAEDVAIDVTIRLRMPPVAQSIKIVIADYTEVR